MVVAIFGNTYYRDWQNAPIPNILPKGQWREMTTNYSIEENSSEYTINYSGTWSNTAWGDQEASGTVEFNSTLASVKGSLLNKNNELIDIATYYPDKPEPISIKKDSINKLSVGDKLNFNNNFSSLSVIKDIEEKIKEFENMMNTETYENGFLAYSYKMVNLLDIKDCCIKCCDIAKFIYPLLSNYLVGTDLKVPPIPKPTRS